MFINSESYYSGQLNIVTSWGDNFLLLRLGHFFLSQNCTGFPFTFLAGVVVICIERLAKYQNLQTSRICIGLNDLDISNCNIY